MKKSVKKKKLKMMSVTYDGKLVPADSKPKLEGLSGWLGLWFIYFIIVGIGMFLMTTAIPFIGIGSSFLPKLISAAFMIWMMVAFFMKKKLFVPLVTIFLIALTIKDLLDVKYLLTAIDIIWIGYFYKSKRVKNTFIN